MSDKTEDAVVDAEVVELGEADITSHHIEGYAPTGEYLKIPLISHIVGNLWTGGCVGDVKLSENFKYVVSLYPWEQYELPAECSRIEVKMYDSHTIPDEPLLFALGDLVADLVAIGPTLVHCQAGLNRSGLIGTMGLKAMGYTSEEAIALLRKQRTSLVLCNKMFENWLLQQV